MWGAQVNNSRKGQEDTKLVKCLVWDLDDTLWDGVLLEDEQVSLRAKAVETIKTLDSRGILHSIASRNEYTGAMKKLKEFGLQEYFIYPQINWNSKVSSIQTIAKSINIGLNSIAFIDDQPFEREEVKFTLPEVLCIDAAYLDYLLNMSEMNPPFITEDSRMRRLMYISQSERQEAEETFVGSREDFLATLNMIFTIAWAERDDLRRAEELTVRTNQLNTTGYTYSYDELLRFQQSEQHKLLIASLEDKFGIYGKVGLALVECHSDVWTIKLLLMSCRVISRGVGMILLNHIMRLAQNNKVHLRAEFVENDRNRMMYVTYRFSGFKETNKVGNFIILENSLERMQTFPEYVQVKIIDRRLN